MHETDVLVIGGGPAGAAAAITCAEAGLRVTLTERSVFPRLAAGETLSPDILPLLRRLGVLREFLEGGFLRHAGTEFRWDSGPTREAFDEEEGPPRPGFQAWRAEFDAMLLRRARRTGVQVFQPCTAVRPILDGGRVVGAETDAGPVLARLLIDATGPRQWLAKRTRMRAELRGAPLTAWYGYAVGSVPERDAAPRIETDRNGWTCTARVREGLYHWCRLPFRGDRIRRGWMPEEFHGLTPAGGAQGADVTWRAVSAPAGPGYFTAGDATAVLDPKLSEGVLRAVTTGIAAGRMARRVLLHGEDERLAAAVYGELILGWFDAEASRLGRLYGLLPFPPEAEPHLAVSLSTLGGEGWTTPPGADVIGTDLITTPAERPPQPPDTPAE